MAFSRYEFETDRLFVSEWHSVPDDAWQRTALNRVVAGLLTPNVTRQLPGEWHGEYSLDRADGWIQDRDSEGTTLLVIEKAGWTAIGLLLVFEDGESADARIGYLLSERSWGKGFATELLKGFVEACRAEGTIASVSAGVSIDNRASVRALEKTGFQPGGGLGGSEMQFNLSLR